MRIKWLLFFLIVSSSTLFAGAPILHLWMAERFCEICNISNKDVLQEIIVGAEFPDIRYITHDQRSLTHPTVSDIKEVYQSKTPFELGMKLHVWLDDIREKFIPQEVYDEVSPYAEGFSAMLLKFIEEEILADFYDGRAWSCYFDKVLPEELSFTKEEYVYKWHKMIQWTMSVRPSNLFWVQSYRGSVFGISANTLYNWSYLLPELKNKLIFQQYMHSLLTHIEDELLKYPAPSLFSEYSLNTVK